VNKCLQNFLFKHLNEELLQIQMSL